MSGPTLTQALAALGYQHEPGRISGKRIVTREGIGVGEFTARECWDWLRANHEHTQGGEP